jgi:hypothetical protein
LPTGPAGLGRRVGKLARPGFGNVWSGVGIGERIVAVCPGPLIIEFAGVEDGGWFELATGRRGNCRNDQKEQNWCESAAIFHIAIQLLGKIRITAGRTAESPQMIAGPRIVATTVV